MSLGTFVFAGAANACVFSLLRSYDDALPRELALQVFMEYNRTLSAPLLVVSYFYFGPLDDAQAYFAQAEALGPIVSTVASLPLPSVYQTEEVACTPGDVSGATLGLAQTDVSTLTEFYTQLMAYYVASPTYNGNHALQRYGNDVTLQTPESATSFPWRDIKTYW